MANFNSPVDNARLTSPFGFRKDPFGKNTKQFHQGVDLASPTPGKKVPVYASADGTVTKAQVLSTYGKVVMIVHTIKGRTYETNYAHLDMYSVKVGQKVKQGQQIGVMGTTGSSTAVHLHFEIHNGRWATGQPNAIDPMKYISLKGEEKDYSKSIGYNLEPNSNAFRLHTTAYDSEETARQASIHFVKDGYMKYSEVFGDVVNGYRVQSGKYTSELEAENASKKILDDKLLKYISVVGNKS